MFMQFRPHNEERYDLQSSSDITRVIKSRRMRWAEYAAFMGKRWMQGYGGENLKNKDHLKDTGVDW